MRWIDGKLVQAGAGAHLLHRAGPTAKEAEAELEKYSDIMDYQAKNVEKIRKRLEHAKRK